MTQQTLALDYGNAPPRRWRRWVRPAAVLLGVASLGIGAWQILTSARVRLLSCQRQCLRYSAPRTTVVYDETPAFKSMIAQPDVRPGTDPRNGTPIFAWREPDCYSVYRMHPTLNVTGAWFSPAPVMLHARDAGGGERLVAVSVQRVARTMLLLKGQLTSNTLFFTTVARPAGWADDVTAAHGSWDCPELSTPGEVGSLRLYAGQPDPADASHFTIACDTAAGRRVIDGWLQKDDTLKLALRPLPATAPATAPGGSGGGGTARTPVPATISPVTITVNGQPQDIAAGTTVLKLIEQHNLTPQKVAVELNRRLIRAEKYDTVLQPGDEVEIVTFVGGG